MRKHMLVMLVFLALISAFGPSVAISLNLADHTNIQASESSDVSATDVDVGQKLNSDYLHAADSLIYDVRSHTAEIANTSAMAGPVGTTINDNWSICSMNRAVVITGNNERQQHSGRSVNGGSLLSPSLVHHGPSSNGPFARAASQ